ncbi:MAG: aldo/keto reductase [Planctomycetaceae bacterium]|jgi:diketogulonate reductase-like aldo/keto reductase|nr:aldo/keto reductase [Planctomycetaceae bacterium]
MKSLSDVFTLANGVSIPCVGFGTWQVPDEASTVSVIKYAVNAGYRHIDTAAAYYNEKSVGKAVRECGVPRDQLFITSKLWNDDRNLGYDQILKAFALTLENLGTDYLDLYLIHWPANEKQFGDKWKAMNTEAWKALEKLYGDKKIRSIGVSNFLVKHLEALLPTATVKPMVDQIEFHPGFMQNETFEFCKQNGIQVEAWSPLGSGKVLSDQRLKAIADKYGKTVAQLCVRWVLQHGVLPLPRSVTESRVAENTAVFDFEISAADVQSIDALPFFGGSGFYPEEATF